MALVAIESKVHNDAIITEIKEKAKFGIDGYPTVGAIVFENGTPKFKSYNGDRTADQCIILLKKRFLKNNQVEVVIAPLAIAVIIIKIVIKNQIKNPIKKASRKIKKPKSEPLENTEQRLTAKSKVRWYNDLM